jgi:bloom syndrome protein
MTRADFASTYVSSPTRETAKSTQRRKQNFVDIEAEDDGDSEDAFEPLTGMHANGYGRDSFVVDDDEDDDYVEEKEIGFAPVRRQKRLDEQSKSRQLGPPITTDPLMDSLDHARREFVNDFVANARELGGKIAFSKQLRDKPFSDTVLRAMALNRVRTKDQMLRIDEIRPEMVAAHGDRFLEILRKLEGLYGMATRGTENKPYDPNHRVVVDLCDSDEEQVDAYGGAIDIEDFEDDEEEEEDDDTGPSNYFAQGGQSVAAQTQTTAARNFIDQYDAMNGNAVTIPKRTLPWQDRDSGRQTKSSPKRKMSYSSGRKASGPKQWYAKTKASGAGVKKGTARKRKSSEGGIRSKTTTSVSRSGSGGGSVSRGGIGLMPT